MAPLDVALKRGHVKTEEFLRGAGMSHVSTHVRVQCWQRTRCLQSWIEIEQYSVVYFNHVTVFEVV